MKQIDCETKNSRHSRNNKRKENLSTKHDRQKTVRMKTCCLTGEILQKLVKRKIKIVNITDKGK